MNYRIYLLTSLISLIFLSGCKKNDYLDIDAASRPPLYSNIKVINATISANSIQLWENSIRQVTTAAVKKGESSDKYLRSQYGLVQYNFTEGKNTTLRGTTTFGGSATFSSTGSPNGPIAGFYHTIIAGPTKNAKSDTLILFYDDTLRAATGKIKFRFVNLAPDTSTTSVGIADGSEPIFNNVTYGSAGGQILSGESLSWRTIGPFKEISLPTKLKISNKNGNLTLASSKINEFTFKEGKSYTVILTGKSGVQPVDVVIIEHLFNQ